MAFWNKSKNKDEAIPSAAIEDLTDEQIGSELEDEFADLPEDELPEDEVQGTENDLMEVDYMSDNDLCTSISLNTEIIGNIVTADNLEVYGSIDGDIASEALVKIYGTVTGQIQCDTLIASGAKITGDITCQKLVEVRANTDIEGDIYCNAASISGNLLGNIKAEQTTSLYSTAVVTGDIATPEFEVEKGAVLNGAISIKKNQPPQIVEITAAPQVEATALESEEPEFDEEELESEVLVVGEKSKDID